MAKTTPHVGSFLYIMKNIKVGIIGVGMVGGSLLRYLVSVKNFKRGKNLFLFDTDAKKGFNDDIDKADVLFLCVPTPRMKNGSAGIGYLKSAFKNISGKKIVVIKSTVPPGTTEFFQKMYPHHKILFNPEFLTEANAWKDMLNPDRQLVGYTKMSKESAKTVLALLPKAKISSPSKKYTLTATEAEIIKYAANVFLTRKVTFANAIYELASAHNANYENIKSGLCADPRINSSHLDVNYHGYRGFGGYCFTKDTDALIYHLKEKKLHFAAKLISGDVEFNKEILRRQNLMPEDVSVHDAEWVKKKMKKNENKK